MIRILVATLLSFLTHGLFASESPRQKTVNDNDLPFKRIIFTVLDYKNNDILASGVETINIQDGFITKNTEYYATGKNAPIIQIESATTDLKTLLTSTYSFKNNTTGEQVHLSMKEPPIARLLYVPKTDEKPQKFEYKWTKNTVIGKTLHHYITRNWADLMGGKQPDFELFVPMKRDHFKFRIRRVRTLDYKGQSTHVISLEPANWAIRALVPRMEFFYTLKGDLPVLVRYEGATTVAINGDDKREVAIEFNYES